MLIGLEAAARRQAMIASAWSVFSWAILVGSWFVSEEGLPAFSWGVTIAISLTVPLVVLLALPLGKVADRLARHLDPEPPSQQFDNVVTEIAIALVEPVESIHKWGLNGVSPEWRGFKPMTGIFHGAGFLGIPLWVW